MLFNSWAFALFFPLVTAVYFALPHRFRWAWLLVASCYFYMAFVPAYILILAVTIAVDYGAGLMMAQSEGAVRKRWLVASLVVNLGMLGFFKYFNFANANVAALAGLLHWNYPIQALAIALPIGLSFHVFQSLAYTIEVYRGNQPAERHAGIFALYVMIYPQLVAGPIERPQQQLPQLHAPRYFDAERVARGLKRMLWGLVKKVVVADRLAMVVNQVYAHPHDHTGVALLLAAVFFTFQIYCDFSGYSDIALGSAEVMGFKLMENFRQPFGSKTVQEFWTRWHISLSSWFNDYVFTPLVYRYREHGKAAVVAATLVTFGLAGLWHGAGWNFVVFGLLHGVAVAFDALTKKPRRQLERKLPGWLYDGASVLTTFAYVAFAFIFFRLSMVDALYVAGHLASELGTQLAGLHALAEALRGLIQRNVVLGVYGVALLVVGDRLGFSSGVFARRGWLDAAVCYFLLLVLIVLGVYESQTFIYFQF